MPEQDKTLKPGWRRVKFGDVVRLSKARSQDPLADGIERYVGLEHLEPGDLRIRRWGNVADGVTFTSVFQPRQVLFGKRRAYQRKVAVADFAGVCSGDIYVLETRDAQVLLPELLPFICQTDAFFDHAVGTSAGSLSPRTNWMSLADFEFALPPISDQRILIELLDAATKIVESLHSLRVTTDKVRLSYLNEFFPENLAERGSKTADMDIRHLSDVAEIRTGLALGKKVDGSEMVERPYLRVANVQDGVLDLNEIKTLSVKTSELGRYYLRRGDVLMTEGGDFDKLGRGAVWREEVKDCLHQNHVFAVRPNHELIRSEYIANLARSPHGKRYFRMCAKRTSNLASINKKQLSAFPVIFLPLDIQDQIISAIQNCDKSEKSAAKRLSDALKIRSQLTAEFLGGVL
jgi:type I restriction enzyme S subunit